MTSPGEGGNNHAQEIYKGYLKGVLARTREVVWSKSSDFECTYLFDGRLIKLYNPTIAYLIEAALDVADNKSKQTGQFKLTTFPTQQVSCLIQQ